MPKGLALSQFQAVLFDVDGTLVDSLPTLILGLGDTYEHFDGVRPPDSRIQEVIGMPLNTQMQLMAPCRLGKTSIEERIAYAISRYRVHGHLEKVFAGAVRCLELTASAGIKTALVTSKNSEEVSEFLDRFAWAQIADTIVSSSDVHNPKPDPESALLACSRLGVEPANALFIGDSIYDIRCANQAQMTAAAVTYGSGARDALLREQPDAVFETPHDLEVWAKETIYTKPCLEKSQPTQTMLQETIHPSRPLTA